MKVIKTGTVILDATNQIKIDGWLVEPEATDPQNATPEQLILELAITWALDKLRVAVNSAVYRVYLKSLKDRQVGFEEKKGDQVQ